MYWQGGYIEFSTGVYLDLAMGVIVKQGIQLALSRIQLRLLERLTLNLCHPVTTEDLYNYIWGDYVDPTGNQLYICVHRTRQIIESNVKLPKYLITVRRKGYILRGEITNDFRIRDKGIKHSKYTLSLTR